MVAPLALRERRLLTIHLTLRVLVHMLESIPLGSLLSGHGGVQLQRRQRGRRNGRRGVSNGGVVLSSPRCRMLARTSGQQRTTAACSWARSLVGHVVCQRGE